MKLSEMKEIASKRSPGGWDISSWQLGHIHYDDANFIALAANTYDKLLAVAEAAREVLPHLICEKVSTLAAPKHSALCHRCELEMRLKALESDNAKV